MANYHLPIGTDALHPDWREARWTVSGLFHKFQFISDYVAYLKEYHDLVLPIESLHDSPNVSWNAGRCSDADLSAGQACRIIDYVNTAGIGVILTFSNHLIEKYHLQDPTANELLDKIAHRPDINGVLIASNLLSDYISGKYPKLLQIASVVKVTVERGKGNADYYRDLQSRYDRLVVHPDDNLNADLISALDPTKTEILVNEECILNCPVRKEYYDCIARCAAATYMNLYDRPAGIANLMWQHSSSLIDKLNDEHEAFVNRECPAYPTARPCRRSTLTHAELQGIYKLGFRHFKLQGRKDELVKYLYNLVHYMLDPQQISPLVFKALAGRLYYEQCDRRIFPDMTWGQNGQGLRASA